MAEDPGSPGGNQDEYPGQLLQQAALYNNKDFLTSLLQGEERQYINSPDRCGRTPLYTAVSNHSLDCTKALLEHKGDFKRCSTGDHFKNCIYVFLLLCQPHKVG